MSHIMMLQQHVTPRCGVPQARPARSSPASRSVHHVASFHSLPNCLVSRSNSQRKYADVRVRVFNFKFGKKPDDSLVNLRNSRSDYSSEDVEDYFNYMGMLAVEGTYDKMNAMLNSGLEAPEILLLWASTENDLPKVQELLGAGARVDCKNLEGKRPEELATKPEILSLLQEFAQKQRVSA